MKDGHREDRPREGSIATLPEVARSLVPDATGPVRVLLVVSKGFGQRPWRDRVLGELRPVAPEVAVHDGMPTPGSVASLAREIIRLAPDVVAAVGGGSVLDAAKCAAVLAGGQVPDRGCEGNGLVPAPDAAGVRAACAAGAAGLAGQPIPVIAVPTTPGTGAEATPFATVWDRGGGRKLSLRGPAVRPAAVILDPDLLIGLPHAQLASCVLDTLAQAMEAMWSTGADARARDLGLAALRQSAGLLGRVAAGHGHDDRRDLLLAGHYSGRAIAIAGTTLCHALSYPITLRYGLAHGHACGVTLGRVLEFNAAIGDGDCVDPRGPSRTRQAIADAMAAIGARSVAEVLAIAGEVMAAGGLGAAGGLRGAWLGARAGVLAAEALGYDRAGNNPRRPGHEQVTQIAAAAAGDFRPAT